MEKHVLMSAALRHVGTVVVLLLLTHTSPELVTSTTVRSLDELSSSYSSIFSPLFKALSEHGGPRWSPALKKKMKPEHRYIKFLSQVYKRSSRVQRSLDGNKTYNTVRLIKPKDECLAQGDKVSYMQDLSFNLDQVRRREQLLKSALLYHLDDGHAAPLNTICYMSVREQEQLNQCHLCPVIQQAVNFTADRRNRKNWVEVDITSVVKPLLKFQKKNIQLLVNVTCPDKRVVKEVTLKPPPLLLYLKDTSKTTQRPLASEKPGASAAAESFHKQIMFRPEQKFRHKRRWKRHALKSKRGDRSFDVHLPDLRSPSEFPTKDCALYDFRVCFSQLKLDHWIVFPPKYNPRYCRGICPKTLGFIYGSPVHTMVQNIIYEKLDSSVPQPSCVPSHYSPLSVMIFEEDGSYVYKEFEDMVATRCTCR